MAAAALASRASVAGKPAGTSDPAVNAEPASPAGDGSDVDKAREHLRKASVHYDLQEFRKALTEFREAYRLKNDPVILFDMGQCNRKMGKYREAIDFYKSYLRKVPSGTNRAEAERLIAESEKLLKDSPLDAGARPAGAEGKTSPPEARAGPQRSAQPDAGASKSVAERAPAPAETTPAAPPPSAAGAGGLGTETLPLGAPLRRHRRGRFRPDAGASSGSDSSDTPAGK